jgi:hypothetical protein
MDPSYAKSISNLVHSNFEWKEENLLLCLRTINGDKQVLIDIAPYLGGAIKATNLHFLTRFDQFWKTCTDDKDDEGAHGGYTADKLWESLYQVDY